MSEIYDFTEDWFSRHEGVWRQLLERFAPARILEIGSYEGRSACFLIDECARERALEVHCLDTWEGGVEHRMDMTAVEARFDANLVRAIAAAAHPVDLHKHKAPSHETLARLLATAKASFDLIYVDGSHQAPDVLTDAVLAFRLLKVGGVIIFDDYLWSLEGAGKQDFYQMPKPAVDAFVNIFQRKLQVLGAPLYQLYARKLSD